MIGGPLNADNSTFSEIISTNAVFSYLLKPRFLHDLQHEVLFSYRGETHNVKQFTMENPLRTKSNISHTVSIKHNALKSSLLSIPHKAMI